MKKTAAEMIIEGITWVREHRDTALTLAGAAAACLGLAIYFFTHYSAVNREAWNKLGYAESYAYGGVNDQAVKILDEIINSNPQAKVLQYARLHKANLLFNMKDFKNAKELYSQIISNAKFKILLPFAYLGLGNTLENLTDYKEAARVYTEFIDTLPENYLIPRAHESLARAYEAAGQLDQAKQTYEKISTLYPGSLWARKSQERINLLLQIPGGRQAAVQPPIGAPAQGVPKSGAVNAEIMPAPQVAPQVK